MTGTYDKSNVFPPRFLFTHGST